MLVADACHVAWNNHPAEIEYRIKDLAGVASLAKLGKDIITSHIESQGTDKLSELTAKLSAVDWEKREDNLWMRSQAGLAGQKEPYEVLYNLVYSDRYADDQEGMREAA